MAHAVIVDNFSGNDIGVISIPETCITAAEVRLNVWEWLLENPTKYGQSVLYEYHHPRMRMICGIFDRVW
jgi:hypothetical protein